MEQNTSHFKKKKFDLEDCIGQNIQYYGNGKKMYEGAFKDGKINGKGICYFESGEKAYEGDFKDGKFNGQGINYNESGKKMYEGNFKDGKYCGHGLKYYENGKKMYEGDFEGNNFNGQGILYYENGKKKYEGDFKYDNFDGQGIIYYLESGKKMYEGDWIDDKYCGHGIYYYKNGNKYEGEFKDNSFNGIGKKYDCNGCILEDGIFLNNKLYNFLEDKVESKQNTKKSKKKKKVKEKNNDKIEEINEVLDKEFLLCVCCEFKVKLDEFSNTQIKKYRNKNIAPKCKICQMESFKITSIERYKCISCTMIHEGRQMYRINNGIYCSENCYTSMISRELNINKPPPQEVIYDTQIRDILLKSGYTKESSIDIAVKLKNEEIDLTSLQMMLDDDREDFKIYGIDKLELLKKNVNNLLPKKKSSKEIDHPDELCCPITMELFVDPVNASDGYIYERYAIERFLIGKKVGDLSPMNIVMDSLNVTKSYSMIRVLDNYKKKLNL